MNKNMQIKAAPVSCLSHAYKMYVVSHFQTEIIYLCAYALRPVRVSLMRGCLFRLVSIKEAMCVSLIRVLTRCTSKSPRDTSASRCLNFLSHPPPPHPLPPPPPPPFHIHTRHICICIKNFWAARAYCAAALVVRAHAHASTATPPHLPPSLFYIRNTPPNHWHAHLLCGKGILRGGIGGEGSRGGGAMVAFEFVVFVHQIVVLRCV